MARSEAKPVEVNNVGSGSPQDCAARKVGQGQSEAEL
jgi:hypothetical protein